MTVARDDAVMEADRHTRSLLQSVSRTFAIGVSLLPPQIELPVRLGYLLCRIADTIEDDLALDAARKAELLDAFAACFDDAECAETFGRTTLELTTSNDYRALVAASDEVFALYRLLDYPTREILQRWVLEMVDGMRTFVLLYPRGIRIANMAEFHQYCYYVAGTVGHLLTDLWQEHSRSIGARVHARLLEDCESFGEALQVVNILKDIAWDADHENSVFIPSNVLHAVGSGHSHILESAFRTASRAALEPLIAIAKNDIERGLCYIENLPLHAVRVRLFCALPILFAVATTREIERSDEMLVPGGAVKISRAEVRNIVIASRTSTLSNRSLRWLVDSLRERPLGLRSVG